MRRLLFVAALVAVCLVARAAESFTASLSAEEFHRAGLDKLSPAERAVLDALVQSRTSGASGAESARVSEADPRATSSAAQSKEVVVQPGTRVVEAAMESRIDGKFTGWEGRTVFRLKNGQQWQVANPGEGYWCPAMMNPRVRITPSSLGGYWMVVEAVELRVRVKLVK